MNLCVGSILSLHKIVLIINASLWVLAIKTGNLAKARLSLEFTAMRIHLPGCLGVLLQKRFAKALFAGFHPQIGQMSDTAECH